MHETNRPPINRHDTTIKTSHNRLKLHTEVCLNTLANDQLYLNRLLFPSCSLCTLLFLCRLSSVKASLSLVSLLVISVLLPRRVFTGERFSSESLRVFLCVESSVIQLILCVSLTFSLLFPFLT